VPVRTMSPSEIFAVAREGVTLAGDLHLGGSHVDAVAGDLSGCEDVKAVQVCKSCCAMQTAESSSTSMGKRECQRSDRLKVDRQPDATLTATRVPENPEFTQPAARGPQRDKPGFMSCFPAVRPEYCSPSSAQNLPVQL